MVCNMITVWSNNIRIFSRASFRYRYRNGHLSRILITSMQCIYRKNFILKSDPIAATFCLMNSEARFRNSKITRSIFYLLLSHCWISMRIYWVCRRNLLKARKKRVFLKNSWIDDRLLRISLDTWASISQTRWFFHLPLVAKALRELSMSLRWTDVALYELRTNPYCDAG